MNSCEINTNSRLYEFLATNYDISVLAGKISAEKNAKISLFNLKKIVSNDNNNNA